jgi:hypothetical protein
MMILRATSILEGQKEDKGMICSITLILLLYLGKLHLTPLELSSYLQFFPKLQKLNLVCQSFNYFQFH